MADSRFDSVEVQSFFPKNSLSNAKKIEFYLPRFTGPNLYIPKEMYLKVDLELCKADGSAPDSTSNVAPINNVLHSLFSECRVYLEDYLVNDNNENYAFKAFMIDTLSFDMNAKYSYLQCQGYYQDTPNQMDAAGNASFGIRRDKFKNAAKTAYTTDPVTFLGKLHSDLVSCECGIIPGIAMRVELTRADVDFTLMIPSVTDTEKYQLKITDATLLCSVATLSADLEKVQLTLNGKSLDGWDGTATEHSDPMMFLRLHRSLGFTDTTTGNNVTMDEFLGGAFFCVYDLTTSSQSYLDFVTPSVRLGNLRLKVEFSDTTVEELTLLMYAEFPSLITIDKFRRIKMSFL